MGGGTLCCSIFILISILNMQLCRLGAYAQETLGQRSAALSVAIAGRNKSFQIFRICF